MSVPSGEDTLLYPCGHCIFFLVFCEASSIFPALLIWLGLQVRQLDDGHAEFDQDMLIDFVTDVAKALATVSGRTKVLLRGLHLAERATEMLEVCYYICYRCAACNGTGLQVCCCAEVIYWTGSHEVRPSVFFSLSIVRHCIVA